MSEPMTPAEIDAALENAIAVRSPRRMRGTRPGCAAGAWLAECERPRFGVLPDGAITVMMHAHPPATGFGPGSLQDSFEEGRQFERRRR